MYIHISKHHSVERWRLGSYSGARRSHCRSRTLLCLPGEVFISKTKKTNQFNKEFTKTFANTINKNSPKLIIRIKFGPISGCLYMIKIFPVTFSIVAIIVSASSVFSNLSPIPRS